MVRVKLLLLDENARKKMGKKEIMLEIPKDKATIRDLLREIAAKRWQDIKCNIETKHLHTT